MTSRIEALESAPSERTWGISIRLAETAAIMRDEARLHRIRRLRSWCNAGAYSRPQCRGARLLVSCSRRPPPDARYATNWSASVGSAQRVHSRGSTRRAPPRRDRDRRHGPHYPSRERFAEKRASGSQPCRVVRRSCLRPDPSAPFVTAGDCVADVCRAPLACALIPIGSFCHRRFRVRARVRPAPVLAGIRLANGLLWSIKATVARAPPICSAFEDLQVR